MITSPTTKLYTGSSRAPSPVTAARSARRCCPSPLAVRALIGVVAAIQAGLMGKVGEIFGS